ncbi:hypothetical protein OWV82_011907 [Melia azedarach]|uniref:Uncharacterized protein n=1 Tax=Melia azedarach TaxID=155640 RepID=A0ACC1XZK7_MELAZ|nr:hypothetical protein OWV82_011907 [Melia azedarach]
MANKNLSAFRFHSRIYLRSPREWNLKLLMLTEKRSRKFLEKKRKRMNREESLSIVDYCIAFGLIEDICEGNEQRFSIAVNRIKDLRRRCWLMK